MANVYGTLFDNGGAVVNVKHTDYGAVGNGSTDDTTAIQAAINAVASSGGVVYFPPGRYKITSSLTVHPVSASYAGVILAGASWWFGATPSTNVGSVIEYSSSTGSALTLGPSSAGGSPLVNFTMRDLAVQATHASYGGNLVDMRAVGKCKFENCGFGGLPGAVSATAAALIYGNFWVDTHFERCQFSTAVVGVKKAVLGGGWLDSVTNVSFRRCVFGRCDTSFDIRGSTQLACLTGCTFEPAISGATAPVLLSGGPSGGVRECWFGDSNGSGTWLTVGEEVGVVAGNYFSSAAVGVELVAGAYDAEISENLFDACKTAVKAASTGLKMRGNYIQLPDGADVSHPSIGLDLTTDTNALVEYNRVVNGGAGSPHYTLGYKLAAGTGGILVDLVGSGPDTLISNGAASAWTTRVASTETYPFGATVNAAYIVNQGSLELQGQLLMTGSAGSPAFSNRFISDGGSSNTFFYNVPSGGSHLFGENGAALLQLEKTGAATNETAAILLRNHSGTWTAQRVSEGATDSGGSGYRVLRIPN